MHAELDDDWERTHALSLLPLFGLRSRLGQQYVSFPNMIIFGYNPESLSRVEDIRSFSAITHARLLNLLGLPRAMCS